MKGVVVTTDGKIRTQNFGDPLYKTVGEVVGGYIEIVHPIGLEWPYVMIVNEDGLILELKKNRIGSILYGTPEHGSPIVGNIVIMKEGYVDGEPDIVGLTDREAESFCMHLKNMHVKN